MPDAMRRTTPFELYRSKKITATTPSATDTDGWQYVGDARELHLTYEADKRGGTNPWLQVHIETTDDNESPTSNAVTAPESIWTVTDQDDSTRVVVPVHAAWARAKFTPAGTTPEYRVSVYGVKVA